MGSAIPQNYDCANGGVIVQRNSGILPDVSCRLPACKRRTRCPHDESGRMPELLVQIRLREWKGVLDQFDPRFRVLSDHNFHYVEAEKYVRVLQHTQPGERAA